MPRRLRVEIIGYLRGLRWLPAVSRYTSRQKPAKGVVDIHVFDRFRLRLRDSSRLPGDSFPVHTPDTQEKTP
jgi:hypothetical protein